MQLGGILYIKREINIIVHFQLKKVALNETQAINEKFGVKVSKKKNTMSKSKKLKSSEIVKSDDEDKQEEKYKPPAKLQKSPEKRKITTTESSDETKDAKRAKKDKSTANEKEFASPAPITSTPFIKSKKRNNTVTSEDTADDDKNVVNYMVQIPMSQADDDQSDASKERKKKKKKEKSAEKKLNKSIHDSEAEVSTSSSVSGGKKKKKDKSPQKNFNRSLHDSEAEASTNSSISECKKSKKPEHQKTNGVSYPGERPPPTVLDYYAKFVYSGKPHKMQKSFQKLSQKEKKELTAQHNEKVEKYVSQLKTYLGSLTKEEAILHVSRTFRAYLLSVCGLHVFLCCRSPN